MVDKSEKVVWLARLGYATRGVVYVLLGCLALTASGRDEAQDGVTGSLEYLGSIPGGTAILYVSALGLLGYALYKFIAATYDLESLGNDIKGIGQRVGYLASGLIHAGLSWTALQLAYGAKSEAEDRTHDLATSALTYDLGPVAIGVVGAALIVGAAFQAKQAFDASFMKHISSRAPDATCWIGRIGHATRGVVFLLMGWSLLRSAWFASSEEARSIGQVLLDLRDNRPAFTIAAAGIVMFGLFSLITARYRIIPDPEAKLRAGPSLGKK